MENLKILRDFFCNFGTLVVQTTIIFCGGVREVSKNSGGGTSESDSESDNLFERYSAFSL